MRSEIQRIGAVGAVLMMAAGGCAVASDDSEVTQASFEQEWNDAYDAHEGGKADTPGCSGVLMSDQGGFGKRIALTFDDGPNTVRTPAVLDTLAAHNAKGTFFINGSKVRGDAERQILQRMLSEGHIVANHGWEHLNLKNLSTSELDRQVRLTHDLLVGLGETRMFFRFPYGSASCSAVDLVEGYGNAVTGWHIDTADWCYASSLGGVGYCSPQTFEHVPDTFRDDMVGYAMYQARSNQGGVMLFHDVYGNTVNRLEDILTALEAEGFTFTNLDDAETFPLLNGLTPPFVGDACSDDSQCELSAGSQGRECYLYEDAVGEPQGFCTQGCEGYCPDRPGEAPTFCTSLNSGATGMCVSKSAPENSYCADLPGTQATTMSRFIGTSGASPSTATVCVP